MVHLNTPAIYTRPGASLEIAPAEEGRKPSDLGVRVPPGSAFARHPDQLRTKRRPRIGTPICSTAPRNTFPTSTTTFGLAMQLTGDW